MGGVVKSFSGVRKRWLLRVVTAVAALALPVAALAAPASGAAVQAGGTARTAADTTACPGVSPTPPVAQRVSAAHGADDPGRQDQHGDRGRDQRAVRLLDLRDPSLCVPAIGEEDGPVGVGDGLTGVTQMPSAVSVAATFDTSLAHQYGQVVGSEERAKGAMVDLGPTVNIDRDPRWGRGSRPTPRTRT